MCAAHWWETAVRNKADELAQALDAAQERRLHPSSFLFLAGAQAWAVLVGFLLPTAINMALDGSLKKILKADAAGTRRVLKVMLPFLGIFGLLPLVGMLHFLSYRFSIRGNDIVIRSGILVKQTRHIPLDKIHNVTLRRNLLHRILGVAEVRLESGGTGEQSEALLRVLSLADAQACIRILQPDGAAFRQPENQGGPPSANLLPLSAGELARYGVIGGTGLGLGGAAGVLFFQVFDGQAWLAAHLPHWTDAFSGNRIGGYTVFYTAAVLLAGALFGKLSAGTNQLGRLHAVVCRRPHHADARTADANPQQPAHRTHSGVAHRPKPSRAPVWLLQRIDRHRDAPRQKRNRRPHPAARCRCPNRPPVGAPDWRHGHRAAMAARPPQSMAAVFRPLPNPSGLMLGRRPTAARADGKAA